MSSSDNPTLISFQLRVELDNKTSDLIEFTAPTPEQACSGAVVAYQRENRDKTVNYVFIRYLQNEEIVERVWSAHDKKWVTTD